MTTQGTKSSLLLAVFAAAATFAPSAGASPLVNLQILGSTSGGITYEGAVGVSPGETFDFEVIGQLAPVGTVNTHGTITSEVQGVDGIGSLSFNLTGPATDTVQVSFASAQLQGTFANGTGPSSGTITSSGGGNNNELAGVRPINPNGTFNALNGSPLVIESGTVTVNSAPNDSSGTLIGTFGGVFSSIKINDAGGVALTSTTESSSDPIESIQPLTIYGPNYIVPEPASLGVFGLAAAGLLARRSRWRHNEPRSALRPA